MEYVERELENKDLMVKKLKKGFFVGKKATPSTPSPIWRVHLLPNSSSFSISSSLYTNGNNKKDSIQEFLTISSNKPTISARKLCANLWETQSPWYPLSTMSKGLHHNHNHNKMPSSANSTTSQPIIGRKTRKSSYSRKTSTEVLKVLNRILSLKQKQASNATLVKSMSLELYRCQTEIKKLGQDKQIDRLDRNKAIVRLVNLNRKLAQEVSKVKSLYSNTFRELRREIEERNFIENLCDKFAKGIQHYEREVGLLPHESDFDQTRTKRPDRLILDISKSWLQKRFDENMDKTESKCLDNEVTKMSYDMNRAATKKVVTRRLSSDFLLDKLTQTKPMSYDRDHKTKDEYGLKVGSRVNPIFSVHANRVQQWMSKPMNEDCTKFRLSKRLPRGIKDNSLHAKLLEARSRVKRDRFSK